MKIKKGFLLREVCGKRVIMGEGLGAIDFGRMLCLNETASWLWKQAEEMSEFDVESLTERLCEEYDVTPDEALKDVTEIITEWQSLNLIEA